MDFRQQNNDGNYKIQENKLLSFSTDKIIFKTNQNGMIDEPNCNKHEHCVLFVTAMNEGVSTVIDTNELQRPYDIKWERVYFGGFLN